jgi:hypothetical protein
LRRRLAEYPNPLRDPGPRRRGVGRSLQGLPPGRTEGIKIVCPLRSEPSPPPRSHRASPCCSSRIPTGEPWSSSSSPAVPAATTQTSPQLPRARDRKREDPVTLQHADPDWRFPWTNRGKRPNAPLNERSVVFGPVADSVLRFVLGMDSRFHTEKVAHSTTGQPGSG